MSTSAILLARSRGIGQHPPRVPPSPPSTGTFPEAILAENPLHYWRLNGSAPPTVDTFLETNSYARDQKTVAVTPIDASDIVIPGTTGRLILDFLAEGDWGGSNGTASSDKIDPDGVATPLDQLLIAATETTGNTKVQLWRLPQSTMPAVGTYVLRATYGVVLTIFRQVIVLQGAAQTIAVNGTNLTSASTISVTVTRASGSFPEGSILYAVCADGQGGQAYTVTGDASKVREDITGWTGGRGYCFAKGTLGALAASMSVTFTTAASVNRLACVAAVVEPSP